MTYFDRGVKTLTGYVSVSLIFSDLKLVKGDQLPTFMLMFAFNLSVKRISTERVNIQVKIKCKDETSVCLSRMIPEGTVNFTKSD